AEARAFNPDLVLLGGDFVNMQLFGAGRVPPKVIAAVLARLDARYGQFAVLGNHDYLYGAREIVDVLRAHAITVLDDESRSVKVKNHSMALVGKRALGPSSCWPPSYPNGRALCLRTIRCGSRTYHADRI